MKIEDLNKKLTEKLLPLHSKYKDYADLPDLIILSPINRLIVNYKIVGKVGLSREFLNCSNYIKQLLFSQDKIKIELALNLL